MNIPLDASPAVQQAFRDLAADVARLQSVNPSNNNDMNGRRLINAGPSRAPTDYVTRAELDAALRVAGGRSTSQTLGGTPVAASQASPSQASDTVDTLTVRQVLRVLGSVSLPRFTDGTAHHGILFVGSDGLLTIQEDGNAALDLNIAGLKLEIGYDLTVYWFNQAGIRSPGVGVLMVVGADATTPAEIQASTFTLVPRQAYTPSNVTVLRAGDFSTLSAADVRSVLGTLITDLQTAGLLG